MPALCTLSRSLSRFRSWSFTATLSVSPSPHISISSAILAVRGRPSITSSGFCWKISDAGFIPNGVLFHLYLPFDVINVVSMLEGLSN